MLNDANDISRYNNGRDTLNALLGAVKQAIKNQDPFPFLPVIKDAVTKALNQIGREEEKRMASFWFLQGVIMTMDAVEDTFPIEAYSRLCWMASSVVNTNSAVWIIGQNDDVQRIIADVLAAKVDNIQPAA